MFLAWHAMTPYRLVFDSPLYLLLLLLVPVLWFVGRWQLADLGTARRWLALSLRTLVAVLLIAALAEVQLARTSQRMTVMYLVDQSRSVPADKSAALVEYVNRSTREQRDAHAGDRAGVIVFGREAAIEAPPLASDAPLSRRFESIVDGEATNLAAALRLARAAFPPDSARRV